ncbi:MAG: hypothetical protein Q8S84_05525 [bacterium]|nr:hypothetical protein [bacterium]MDP3380950.1 hypothetical protein [bacterium]
MSNIDPITENTVNNTYGLAVINVNSKYQLNVVKNTDKNAIFLFVIFLINIYKGKVKILHKTILNDLSANNLLNQLS